MRASTRADLPLSPDSALHAKAQPAVPPNLLRHHDGNLLFCRSAAPVRPDHHDGVLPRFQRLREMPEGPVRRNIRHRLAVDDQRRARLRLPDQFRHAPVNLRALDFQQHVLRLALRHQRELERLAEFAGLLSWRPMPSRSRNSRRHPVRVTSALVPRTFTSFTSFVNIVVGLIRSVYPTASIHRLPLKPDLRRLRILRNDRRQVQRRYQSRRRQHIRFLRRLRRSGSLPFSHCVSSIFSSPRCTSARARRHHDFVLVLASDRSSPSRGCSAARTPWRLPRSPPPANSAKSTFGVARSTRPY